jgi:hypothetical protein
MEHEKPDAMQQAAELRVSDELLGQLHAANARLHEARRKLEESMDGSDYEHQHHVDQSGDELRAAERAVEEVSEKIHKSLKPALPDASVNAAS